MHNIFLFARREFLERVRTKAFVITTILFPAMMLGFTILPTLLMSKSAGVNKIVIVASNDALGKEVAENLKSSDADAPKFEATVSTDTSEKARDGLLARIGNSKKSADHLDGMIWASDEAIAANKPIYYGSSVGDFNVIQTAQSGISRAVQHARMAQRGVPAGEIDSVLKPVDMEAHQVANGEVKGAAGMEVFFTPFALMFFLYFTVLIYGMAVMRSVVEEKNSKIFEVLLSSATSKQLMAGKVLGVGLVGIAQILIWAVAGMFFSGPAIAGAGRMLKFTPAQFAYFGLFFVLAFLLYSALFAAVGAMVNSDQEAQQLQTFVMLPLILCMVFITKVIADPNGAISFWASMFPLTSPLIMYVRIIAQRPPVWQIATSIVIDVISIYVLLALCSRIYRVGILMYGKRPTLPEIAKWIKYA